MKPRKRLEASRDAAFLVDYRRAMRRRHAEETADLRARHARERAQLAFNLARARLGALLPTAPARPFSRRMTRADLARLAFAVLGGLVGVFLSTL